MYEVRTEKGNKLYFKEEASIDKDLRLYDNDTKVDFSVLPKAFEYAKDNGCELKSAIVYWDGVNKAIYPNSGSIVKHKATHKATLEVSPDFDIKNQYAGLYCVHTDDVNTPIPNDGYIELVASYPLINYINQINGRSLGNGVESPAKTSFPPSKVQGGQTSSPSDVKSEPVKGEPKPVYGNPSAAESPYSAGPANKDTEYHLRIECGNGELPISSVTSRLDGVLPTDKFGAVRADKIKDEPLNCSVYADDNDNLKKYVIEPQGARANTAVTDYGNKLGVSFNKPGIYNLIVETQNHDPDVLFVHANEKVLPVAAIAGKIVKGSPAAQENPLKFLNKSVYGEDEINAQIFYRKTPLNRWKGLEGDKLPTQTLNNGLSTKKAHRLSYKELFRPKQTRLGYGMGHLSVSDIDNLKIVPEDGYELNIIKIKEETNEGMLPSNRYYFVLTNKDNGDTDVVQADVYLNKTLKKLKGATPLSIVKHDFLNRSPKFNRLVTTVPVKDYETYLAESYGIKAEEVSVKTGLKGIPISKEPQKREVSTVYLKKASNLDKLHKKNAYKVELKYESLGTFGKPVLVRYDKLEKLLLPTPYTFKDIDKNSLEMVCAGDQESNEFIYTDAEKRRLLIELLVNPKLEELKGALTTTAILGSLSGANIIVPAASASSSGANNGAAGGTITGGRM